MSNFLVVFLTKSNCDLEQQGYGLRYSNIPLRLNGSKTYAYSSHDGFLFRRVNCDFDVCRCCFIWKKCMTTVLAGNCESFTCHSLLVSLSLYFDHSGKGDFWHIQHLHKKTEGMIGKEVGTIPRYLLTHKWREDLFLYSFSTVLPRWRTFCD